MLKCPICHSQLEDDALFCDSCGARIEQQPSAPESLPPQSEQSVYCSHCGHQTGADSPSCPNCGASMEETLFCPDCGKQVDASSPDCPHCSFKLFETVFCPNCGSPSNPEAAFCKNCGASMKPEKLNETSSKMPEAKHASKSKKGFVFAGVGTAIIAVIVLAVVLFGKNTGSSSNYVMYMKDLELFYSDLSKSAPLQISSKLLKDKADVDEDDISVSDFGDACKFSEDGSLLFFPDRLDDGNIWSIYYCSIDKPDKEPIKIDSNIYLYTVSDDASSVTYIKNDTLYQYNMKKDDKQKIANDVSRYWVSDDGSTIVYKNNEDTLYYTVKGGDREKIDSSVSSLYAADDLSVVFYLKDDSLYKREPGGDKEKISSDVAEIIKVYDSGEVYYLKADEEEATLSDFIFDDKKKEDDALTEPTYPNTSWSDPARESKIDAYNREMEEYSLKLERDYLREALKNQTVSQPSYTLCFYDGEEENILSETFVKSEAFPNPSYSVALDAPVITYTAYEQTEEINIKLSEIKDIYDITSRIDEAFSSASERYVASGSASSLLDEEDAQRFRLSADGSALYYFDDIPEDKNYGELYQVSVSSAGELGDPELYDSDVYCYSLDIYSDGTLLYLKDYQDEDQKGDLYINGEKIDYDVTRYTVNYNEDTGRLTYLTDYNFEKQYGTLKTYAGKEPEKIADDVYDYRVLPNGNILYLYDYSLKHHQGELYLWNKKEPQKIDDDVFYFIDTCQTDYAGGV